MKKLFRQMPVLKLPNSVGGGYVFRHNNLSQEKAVCLTRTYEAIPSHDSECFIMEYEYV